MAALIELGASKGQGIFTLFKCWPPLRFEMVEPQLWPTFGEGGRMAADVAPLGDAAIEAFFVGNAELILPA